MKGVRRPIQSRWDGYWSDVVYATFVMIPPLFLLLLLVGLIH